MNTRIYLLLVTILLSTTAFAQVKPGEFDDKLAKSLNADEYGMKKYVFCLLRSGDNMAIDEEEKAKLFQGHMESINKLAESGKLIIAGPFMKNEKDYRGVFIFNVDSIDEALELTKTDPAIDAGLLSAELIPWYGSAALQLVPDLHQTVQRTKM